MPSAADVETIRSVKREVTRRPIDSSRLDVYAMHGVVYMRGFVGPLKGHDVDIKHEIEVLLRSVKMKPGIRDVVAEIEYARA